MKFKVGKRFRVVSGPLAGMTGVVSQALFRDHGRGEEAWCLMDERREVAGYAWSFPADDPSGRGRDACLWGEDCEPERPAADWGGAVRRRAQQQS